MKLIYSDENNITVNHAKNILENAGILVMLKNEHTSTGMYPQFMYLELWVMNDSDQDKALELISTLKTNSTSVEWHCPECEEENDSSFEICWNCKHEHQQ